MRNRRILENTDLSDGSPLVRRIGYLAIKLGELASQLAEEGLTPLDISPREYNVLASVAAYEGLSQQDLSERLGLYAPALVGLIDNLERHKLITRERSAADRRRYCLALTEKGRKVVREGDRLLTKVEENLLSPLNADERAIIKALLTQMLAPHWPFKFK
jgi:DNA-binding MarR family transcriptional regulator